MTTKTIVFDFGGVLFDTSEKEFYRERFENTGRSKAELDYFLSKVFLNSAERSASNAGDVRGAIEEKVKQHPEWADDLRAYNADRDFVKVVRGVLPGMRDVLEELEDKGYRIMGLTNWAGDTYETLPKAFPDILGHFNQVVVSGKVHLKKPDEKIFRHAQEDFGNPDVSEVYYFDDKPKNVAAAQKAVGWNAFVFKDANTVRQALALAPKPF